MKTITGSYSGSDKKIGIVVSRFNEFLSEQLLEGCTDTLIKLGVNEKDITSVWVPGCFEIAQIISCLAEEKEYHALIALGVLIRGDTPHFEYIASELAKGLAQVSLNSKVPVVFGVITADSLEQAIERSGTKSGNRGRDAAHTAIEMANIYQQVR